MKLKQLTTLKQMDHEGHLKAEVMASGVSFASQGHGLFVDTKICVVQSMPINLLGASISGLMEWITEGARD